MAKIKSNQPRQSVAERLGGFVGKFNKAKLDAQGRKIKSPVFIKDIDKYAEWFGGDISDIGTAARRAVQNPWFFSGVSIIVQEISVAEAQIFRIAPMQEDVEIPNHPLEMVLNNPNEYLGKTFVWQYTVWWMELAGDAYWFNTPNEDGELAEIWPLPSDQVTPVTGEKEGQFVDYYELSLTGKVYRIPVKYITHFKYPNPFDIHRGLSRLVPAMVAIDGDNAMARWNATFFGSDNVMPSSIINVANTDGTEIDDADIEAIKNDLMADYPAFRRKTIVTSADEITVTPLGYSGKDMEFDRGRRFSKEEILIILGIPAGVVDKNVTEASANEADRVLKEKKIWPLLCLMAEQINAQIVKSWYVDEKIKLAFKDIRPTQNALDMKDMSQAEGILTIDEVRQKYLGFPPLPDGKGRGMFGGNKEVVAAPNQFEVPGAGSTPVLPPAPRNPQLYASRSLPVREISTEPYIKRILKSVADQLPAGVFFKYASYQQLVLEHGTYQKGNGVNPHYKEDLWTEGYATLRNTPMPIHHMWWTSPEGEVHDDTNIAGEIIEYLGVICSPDLSKSIKASLFMDDVMNGSKILKDGLTGIWNPRQEQLQTIKRALLVAARSDLDKWQKKAIKAFKESRQDGATFESEFILPIMIRAIQERLVEVKTEQDIKEVFKGYHVQDQV